MKQFGEHTRKEINEFYDVWIETTTRKSKSRPRLCRDMFISKYHEEFTLVCVKNSVRCLRVSITKSCACILIDENNLIEDPCATFNNCTTYRTKESKDFIKEVRKNSGDYDKNRKEKVK